MKSLFEIEELKARLDCVEEKNSDKTYRVGTLIITPKYVLQSIIGH